MEGNKVTIKQRTEKCTDDGSKAVGQMLEEYIRENPHTAANFTAAFESGKTLDGAYKAISDYAKKKSPHAPTVVYPEEAFKIVKEYFGITESKAKVTDITDFLL